MRTQEPLASVLAHSATVWAILLAFGGTSVPAIAQSDPSQPDSSKLEEIQRLKAGIAQTEIKLALSLAMYVAQATPIEILKADLREQHRRLTQLHPTYCAETVKLTIQTISSRIAQLHIGYVALRRSYQLETPLLKLKEAELRNLHRRLVYLKSPQVQEEAAQQLSPLLNSSNGARCSPMLRLEAAD